MDTTNPSNAKIVEYLTNQLVRNKARLAPYVMAKPSFSYPRRFGFYRIQKYIKDFLLGIKETPRWIILPGLSGMGKTTILAQLYFAYASRVEPNHILYISLDDVVSLLGSNLKDVLLAYESILGKSFEELDKKVIIFVDEAHRDPKWASILNSIYNKAPNVLVVCSGSSAVLLQVQKEDLGRRTVFEKLYPLCFTEYIMIKKNFFPDSGLKGELKDAIFSSKSADEAYEKLQPLKARVARQWNKIDKLEIDNYLNLGSLPYAARTTNPAIILQGINTLLDKIIAKDINELGRFEPDTLATIKRLLFIVADSSEGISVNKASSALGINAITLTNIFEILEKAELIIRVPPHGSTMTKVRKPAKFLFMSPAIRRALLDITGNEGTFLTKRGIFLEDLAALYFYREFVSTGMGSLTYDSAQGSADFILGIEHRLRIAIEIGMGDKDVQQVLATMDKVKCHFGVVISDSELILVKEKNVLKLPHKFFC